MAITEYFKKNQYRNLFLLVWLLLALFQAGFTELLDDEAYYWVYSRHLNWGYFDHPPMVALLIKAGYALFHNEFGVRLGMVILNLLTLIITDKLIPRRDNRLFYLLLCVMGTMQLGGMLTVPDIPLIFFTSLFFLIYRNFLEQQSWKNTLLLALSMALMFYSKYHGILIVAFTVISNLNLLRVFKFYVACIVTTILFMPHLYWQFAHHFPSLQYHLVERNASTYRLTFTNEYILGQVLLFGPIAGWLILYCAFVCPIQNTFERALKFCVIGVLSFFLLSTIKGRVEANWTVMIFTPAMILAHQAIRRKRSLKWSLKILPYLAVITVIIVTVVRVYMVWDFMPGVEIRPEIHHNKQWAEDMKKQAAGRPVVFINSYQWPSKYMFYSGEPAYVINSRYSRRSQYNYWDTEKQLWGKPVMIAFTPENKLPVTDSFSTAKGHWKAYSANPYYSYSLITLEPAMQKVTVKRGEHMPFILHLNNGYNMQVPVDKENEAVVGYAFEEALVGVKSDLSVSRAIDRQLIRMEVIMPEKPGTYHLKFCVFSGILPPTHNSQTVTVVVKDY
ncbi:ArnT family glycosyltransferase [Chitinophaga rhizophila]|uniref:Glycosyltransferase family 39 protein n=1 Tax=Chitinophaga rhizophila TaxID=2866212 RepID=A0ABS7GFA3_9BACT|nr:glycosyltransferase family 39 protein [Chitinophaga rhizophila]MBW8686378.1 glycosyltransferase family 39 protein [Chitinophaga rhizophila]